MMVNAGLRRQLVKHIFPADLSTTKKVGVYDIHRSLSETVTLPWFRSVSPDFSMSIQATRPIL